MFAEAAARYYTLTEQHSSQVLRGRAVSYHEGSLSIPPRGRQVPGDEAVRPSLPGQFLELAHRERSYIVMHHLSVVGTVL